MSSPRRILRRYKRKNIRVFADMYRTITDKIVRGEPGDSYESVERSSRLMLDMEEALRMNLPEGKGVW